MTICQTFTYGIPDPVKCRFCHRRLADHPKYVRQRWFKEASDLILLAINERNAYLNQSEPKVCTIWRPKHFDDITLCECGRLETEHNLAAVARGKSIIRRVDKSFEDPKPLCAVAKSESTHIGILCDLPRGHTQDNPVHQHTGPRGRWAWVGSASTRVASHPCKFFHPLTEMPGRCRWCGMRYVDHPVEARGTAVEDYDDFHSPHCASVVKGTGHHKCSCLTDDVKQQMLDQMSVRGADSASEVASSIAEGIVVKPVDSEERIVCQKFETDDLSDWNCDNCGKRFYDHLPEHREGFDNWSDWRCAHMSNSDVIQWFLDLGLTEDARCKAFAQRLWAYDILDKTWPPSEKLIHELYGMLPGRLRMLVDSHKPRDKSKDPPERDTCFNCGCVLVKPKEVSICVDCVKLATQGESVRYDPNDKERIAVAYGIDLVAGADTDSHIIKPFD